MSPRLSYLVVVSAIASLALQAQTHPAPSAKPAPILVELFTSEGCSSCPPADTLLRQINGTTTGAGQPIVGISEHVTYWNSLGWSDPYSSETYTARQNAYGQRFRLESVYTPQMVIDGAEQIVGSNRPALLRAFAKETTRPRIALHILSIATAQHALTVTFSAGAPANAQPLEIVAVLTDDAGRSTVLRGENSGHTLEHVAVARAIAHLATINGAVTSQQSVLPVPPSFHPDRDAHHLILFAQEPNQGPILGVDTRPI